MLRSTCKLAGEYKLIVVLVAMSCASSLAIVPALAQSATSTMRQARREFQSQSTITAKPFTFVFSSTEFPKIVWRDVDEVRRLGADGDLRVRWFDVDLNESVTPTRPGRWGAYIEATAPNGTPVRRAMTFYRRPPGFFLYQPRGLSFPLPYQPGPISAEVWREHQNTLSYVGVDMLLETFNNSERGAVMLAGLSEASPLGRGALEIDSAAVRNDDFHLALKMKIQGFSEKARPLTPPRSREKGAAPVLREGSWAEAGVAPGAKERIDAICRAWAADAGVGFVTLVARHGVIVTHEPFGTDSSGHSVTDDFRCDVASITKVPTAILFSQFLDQDLISLDDRVSVVFPDYESYAERVPTFRQCFTHVSGLSGHGDWGGCANPHLENVILNGIDVNEPGKQYEYSGMGFDLAMKAMEIVSGKSWRRLYEEYLFRPLGIGDVPMSNASSGARFTARELATLAQWLANHGSYGEMEFVASATFAQLLPEPLSRRYPTISEREGIGNHWMKHLKPGASSNSTRPDDLILSPRTVGHGSLSGCMFLVDLEKDLIVVQVRQQTGPRYAEWSTTFLQAIADAIEERPRKLDIPKNIQLGDQP